MEAVLILVAFASSALTVGATSAGAAEASPAPLPLSPPGETSNPTLENDRANFHKYLNEAGAELAALIGRKGASPVSKCSESVTAEIMKLTGTLVSTIHPRIVTLKAELAADGSLNPSLLKEVGVELEAVSTVLQRVRKRSGPCVRAMPGSGSTEGMPPARGPQSSTIETLQHKWEPLVPLYNIILLNVQIVIEQRSTERYAIFQTELTKAYNELPAIHKGIEALEEEYVERSELNSLGVKQTTDAIKLQYRLLTLAVPAIGMVIGSSWEREIFQAVVEASEGKCPGSFCS